MRAFLAPNAIALISFLVTACAGSYNPQISGKQAVDAFGQALVTKEPIEIAANLSHVTFSEGRVVDRIQRFTPYCELVVNSLAREPRMIPPGRYPIISAGNRMARDEVTGFPSFGYPRSENMFAITTIRLQDSAGGVRALICKREYPSSLAVRFPLRDQINQVLSPALMME